MVCPKRTPPPALGMVGVASLVEANAEAKVSANVLSNRCPTVTRGGSNSSEREEAGILGAPRISDPMIDQLAPKGSSAIFVEGWLGSRWWCGVGSKPVVDLPELK